ncbi:macrophage mannose receptor 1-like [Mastacembelus armatus]|uniref:macrophage mannose receptor 1-like n=1 Tax=Mastacembelus armatus TaxID=205130 RepID=UPI000E45F054|nr:macrophage mannose receptor 1-like [Mastacembelus armatus]
MFQYFSFIFLSEVFKKYNLINESLTWYEAQSFCRLKYNDLATVDNMTCMKELVNVTGGQMANTWIGLYKGEVSRWMWSDGSGPVKLRWGIDPLYTTRNESCGQIHDTGLWDAALCGNSNGYVCYERLNDGSIYFTYYKRAKNWVDSLEKCRSLHTDMAFVRNEGDRSVITGLLQTGQTPSTAWIGLFHDTWMWSDGSKTSFRYWLGGTRLQGNCASVAALQKGRWVEAPCTDKAAFICQGGLKVKKIIIRIKVHSEVDLTDSTFSDALLKKLEANLRHQGVTDFNMKWSRWTQIDVAEKMGANC